MSGRDVTDDCRVRQRSARRRAMCSLTADAKGEECGGMCVQEGGASVDHVKTTGLSNQLSWIHSAGVGSPILPDNHSLC